MLLQLFLTLQLGIYLLISDLPERPAGRSFCKQKTPQLYAAKGFSALLFWTVRNMEKQKRPAAGTISRRAWMNAFAE